MRRWIAPLLLVVLAGCSSAQGMPFDKERTAQKAALVTLCQQVRDLDFDIATAASGFAGDDNQQLVPGLKKVRQATAQQYNDMMGPIQRANQGGTYGLPEKIGKGRPDCPVRKDQP